MIVPKTTIVFHAAQAFFNFLAMCCFASCAAFQAKWKVGPCMWNLTPVQPLTCIDNYPTHSGLVGLCHLCICLGHFLLLVYALVTCHLREV